MDAPREQHEYVGQCLVEALAKHGEKAVVVNNGPYYRDKIKSADGIVTQYSLHIDGWFAIEIDPRFTGDWKEKKFLACAALAILVHYKKVREVWAFMARCDAARAEARKLNKRFRLRKNSLHLVAPRDSIQLEMSVKADEAQIRAMAKAARACGLLK